MADGKNNPFGNGSGGASGANAGSNNFLTNPGGGGGKGSGRDLLTTQPLPVTTGDPLNPASVPAGGEIPIVTSPEENTGKPFKVGQ